MKFNVETMKTRLSPLLLAVLTSAAMAQAPGTKGVAIQPLEAYDVSQLPDDHYGRLARYGKELTDRTFAHIGPQAKNPAMRYAGNNLACANCHLGAGAQQAGLSLVGPGLPAGDHIRVRSSPHSVAIRHR